jgi:ATP-binding cassette subfamily F protein uup
MNYLSIENLTKVWHDKPVLKNVTFGIQAGEKVALVAGNGQGKSTLLSIIMGQESPNEGKAIIRKEIKVGYLPQEPELLNDLSVIDNILLEENEISKVVRRYEHVIEMVESGDSSEEVMGFLENATEQMNLLNAWDYESKVKQVLSQLKISNFNQLAGSLSGGQRKRVALAKVLLSQPDFLIMDEPTNHLDLEMIEWLEGFLSQRDLTLFLVTHDRYFLDRVCNSIIEIDNGTVYHYKGNYAYYVQNKAEREANAASELEKDKNLFRRELEWVRRMPKARSTKSKSRVESFNDLEEKIRSQRTQLEVKMTMRMERMGSKILELHHVGKAFEHLRVLDDFSYVFKNKEKVGIIGPNGVGKSTLLNIIMGSEPLDSGKVVLGDTVKIGYYSQQGIKVDESKKVIDVIRDVADWIPMANGNKLTASQMLLQFGFDYDKQFDFVNKLSGGERRRLFLLTILMEAPNFLILDEPTNDLDIKTLTVLEDFLESYEGCVIIVSHDRFFMDKLVDHCFIFEGNGVVRDFPGNYTDYRDSVDFLEAQNEVKKSKGDASKVKGSENSVRGIEVNNDLQDRVFEDVQLNSVNGSVNNSGNIHTQLAVDSGKPVSNQRKLSFKEKFELDTLEKELPQLQERRSSLERSLNDADSDYEQILQITQEISELNRKIDDMEFRWLELSEG